MPSFRDIAGSVLRDDRGNPLLGEVKKQAEDGNHKGNSTTLDPDKKKYPLGFTPPIDFYFKPSELNAKTNKQVEYGNRVIPTAETFRTNEDGLNTRLLEFDFYEDYSTKKFLHLLDYFESDSGLLRRSPLAASGDAKKSVRINTKDIYLGSFVQTISENEDPTMLGFDLVIKTATSPLFNGEIDKFIETFGKWNKEISSRKEILDNFKTQLFKFLKSEEFTNRVDFINGDGTKVYYLKSITGLDFLTENIGSKEQKYFNDYGADIISLDFNEDVTQNMGYLSSLYKSLSWSRLRGKNVIPENLLRFDVEISITEIRKYNRVFSSSFTNYSDGGGPDLLEFPDLISKYIYTVYECQFFFPKFPHSDTLNMSAPVTVDSHKIDFNYKFSTMRFEKFGDSAPAIVTYYAPETGANSSENHILEFQPYVIDNAYAYLNEIKPDKTNDAKIEEKITPLPAKYPRPAVKKNFKPGTAPKRKPKEGLESAREKEKENNFKEFFEDAAVKLGSEIISAGVREANRQIRTQAALLNKTLENIRNAIPFAGRLSEPTNVYNNDPFRNDVVNAFRSFVGGSVRSFFKNP